jgi:ketosteroid isomerase-like protein
MSQENVESTRRSVAAFNRVEVTRAWADGSFELAEVIDVGADKVVLNSRREARGRASGAGVQFSYWVVTTFRNGRALRIEWFSDRGEALKAAGMSE